MAWKLLWLLTGNLGKPGAEYAFSSLAGIGRDRGHRRGEGPTSPVVGAPLISGLVPCNVIAAEILTDHPARYRAILIESGNPAHSLADSARMREALRALDLVVVIDVAMTIHARLVEASGALTEADYAPLRTAVAAGRAAFGATFLQTIVTDRRLAGLAPVLLYRTLGPTLPDGGGRRPLGAGAHVRPGNPSGVERAGYGVGPEAGERLFQAIRDGEHGVVITDDEDAETWQRLCGRRIQLELPELLAVVAGLPDPGDQTPDPQWPFTLSAGERRAFTANTILRDPSWRRRDLDGALRMSSVDAERLGIEAGDRVRLTTRRASVVVTVEPTDRMRTGHLSRPNGFGLGVAEPNGEPVTTGIAPNELTRAEDRDEWAGTPWHTAVPSRVDLLAR